MTRQNKTELSYPERLDIPQVTLTEAREQILLSAECKQKRGAVILVGESGLGKSQIFRQISQELGYNLRVIHTAHWSLLGSGIPQKTDGNFFDIAVPSMFPQSGEKCILLFDELNRGLRHAIDSFFSLLEDGRLLNYTLPEDCIVVGTMNPDTENYSVTNIENEAAIRRRVKFMYVIPEYTGWYNHAKSKAFHAGSSGPAKGKPCHPQVLSYFRANPGMLYDTKARDSGKQYICPATVETISEDAYNLNYKKQPLDGNLARIRFSASIGNTETAQLLEYIKDNTVMLGATDILDGYTAATRKAVKMLLKTGRTEKLTSLSTNVLKTLFAEKPAVDKTADSLLRFWVDLPDDLTASMWNQLKADAIDANAMPYLSALIDALNQHELWLELILKVDQEHTTVAKDVTK